MKIKEFVPGCDQHPADEMVRVKETDAKWPPQLPSEVVLYACWRCDCDRSFQLESGGYKPWGEQDFGPKVRCHSRHHPDQPMALQQVDNVPVYVCTIEGCSETKPYPALPKGE